MLKSSTKGTYSGYIKNHQTQVIFLRYIIIEVRHYQLKYKTQCLVIPEHDLESVDD